jgi:hypothetical protein
MTAGEAVAVAAETGIVLSVSETGTLLANPISRLPPEIKAALVAHLPRVIAALQLREALRPAGFDEADLLLIVTSILDGKIDAVRIFVPAPPGTRPA